MISRASRRALIALTSFSALTSLLGCALLLGLPGGDAWRDPALLRHTPFLTFVGPALLLGGVVGLGNAAASLLAVRHSRWTVDAALFAGGALTLWVVAETALFRTVTWLGVLYLGVGLATLLLASWAGWKSGIVRHRWVVAVTWAEGLGFFVPVVAGVLTAHAHLTEASMVAILVGAGMIEGLLCGLGQAFAFPLRLHPLRFALLTACAAGSIWTLALASPAIFIHSYPLPQWVLWVIATLGVTFALLAIGVAQFLELRHHTPWASRWIGWTALAWTVALPFSFAASPLVDIRTPPGSQLALFGASGLLMAYALALMTWQGVRRVISATPRRTLLVQGPRVTHLRRTHALL